MTTPRVWWFITICCLTLIAAGCTATPTPPQPSPSAPTQASSEAVRASRQLAAALAAEDVSTLEFQQLSGVEANRDLAVLVKGMGPVKPEITMGAVAMVDNDKATAQLDFSWSFPGVPKPWKYPTTASLARGPEGWRATWAPTLVHPQLDATTRLSQRRLTAERGELLGEDGDPIMKLRPVVRIGLDKANVTPKQQAGSARKLAELVDIDPDTYVKQVAAAGPEAFVEALVLREGSSALPANTDVYAIEGGMVSQADQMLAPNRDFARPVIGTVGPATKEIVDESQGAVVGGDQVGLSGLQRRYDPQLRGTPGVRVQLRARGPAESAPGSAPPTSPASASPAADPVTVFEVQPVRGTDLTTTINVFLQTLAEKTLSKTKPASALVVVRPSTGAIVAVANGSGAKGQSVATVGHFPPGSTFKVVSSLALLREGMKPSSTVRCPSSLAVDGKRFKNYDDYPASALGRISLLTAVAQSCNTAFIGQRNKLADGDLAAAAGSLGLGIDYDAGYPSFFGSVPADPTGTEKGAAMIGQGQVLASPMSMAAVAASVSAEKTVVPHLIEGQQPTSTAKPLTEREAKQLKQLMAAVVTKGSGGLLSGVGEGQVLAKSGTAEFGTGSPPKTHAWMIGVSDDLAVAVLVAEGRSGSRTAGPLLKAFLAGAQ